ncbi:MAG: hypothetical protein ACTTKL_09140 [Treponema sp.]
MKKRAASALCVLGFFFIACRTMADYDFQKVDHALEEGNYGAAYEKLVQDSAEIYSPFDKALEALDKGILLHYAGDFAASNKALSSSEELFRTYAAKSVSQSAGSLLINDTVTDYAGDPYEDVYANVFMALNYLHLGKFDDAMVEIRRFDTKLKEISAQYQAEIEAEKMELDSNARSVPSAEMKFHNSALAHYVSMLLYRADGDEDNAAVDARQIQNAFEFQSSLYDFPIPQSIDGELGSKSGACRLNLLAFTGRAPEKVEESLPLWALDAFYRIALPVMKMRKSSINTVEFFAENTETGEGHFSKAEKIESIENIAVHTYEQKYALVVAKTVTRMIAKLAAGAAFDAAADNVDDGIVSAVFAVLGFASKISAFATERADVRTARYFPANAFVSGISLKEGDYDVKVVFKHGNRIVFTRSYRSVRVKKNGVNLVEAFCLR